MKAHRMSAAPWAQYCAKAPAMGAGASLVVSRGSSAVHALWAGEDKASAMLARLSDDELAEISEWEKPSPVEVHNRVLRYEDAEKEVTVAIDDRGAWIDPDDPNAFSVGHCDFVWVVTFDDGTTIVYVADLKRSEYTATEGPDSLQLVAYALALVSKHCADGFATGIWSLQDGEWMWSQIIEMSSPRAEVLRKRVLASLGNTEGDYSLGTHCMGCYGRRKCPAYLLPLDASGELLQRFSAKGSITAENAAEALLLAKRASDTADVIIGQVKAEVKFGLRVVDAETGKVYKPIPTKGRETIDKEALEASGITIPKKRGAMYDTYKWVKA